MTIARCIVVVLSLLGICSAQLPAYYKTVNRVIWVVENIDKVRPAWEALGLSDIREYPNIRIAGEFRGKPTTIYAWQITGRLGNLIVDMIQPAEGQRNAYTNFLTRHGDGILSIVHEVPDQPGLDKEIARMKMAGVRLLQKVTVSLDDMPVTYTLFDTEPEGKFALGLLYAPRRTRAGDGPAVISHFGAVVWDAEAVSAYWAGLGFPRIKVMHLTTPDDSMYKGEALPFSFDCGVQRHTQFKFEWISPPPSPSNIYADFLNRRHREGIHHIGMPVANMSESIAALARLGYHVEQSSARYAFMNTESVGGISVELVHN